MKAFANIYRVQQTMELYKSFSVSQCFLVSLFCIRCAEIFQMPPVLLQQRNTLCRVGKGQLLLEGEAKT